MTISFLQIVLIGLWGMIAGMGAILDESQTHRPLISATVVGIILGIPVEGLMIGGTLELIALAWSNIGAAIAPDTAIASIVAVILAYTAGGNLSPVEAATLGIPVASAGLVLAIFARTITVAFQHMADRAGERGDLSALNWIHLGALIVQALRVAIPVLIVAMIASASVVQGWLNSIPEVVTDGLAIAGGMMSVIGYAMVVNMMKAKHTMPFFFLGFVVASFTSYNLIALGIIGLVMALVYLQLSPKFNKSSQVVMVNASDDLDNELD